MRKGHLRRLAGCVVTTALASVVLVGHSAAQGGPPQGPPGSRGSAGAPDVPRQRGAPQSQREQMERRVHQRIESILRTRLSLTDDQFMQLRTVSSRMEDERRRLRRDEVSARTALRRELLTQGTMNEPRIAELLEQLPRLERRRVDINEREHRELARFLAPSQRARYFALQDLIRREQQDAQRRRGGMEQGPPAGRQPPLDPPPSRRLRRPPPV